MSSWWRAVRSAGPARLAYEAGLALALTATAVGLPGIAGSELPTAVAVLAGLADIVLIALRRAYPATVLVLTAVLCAVTGQNGLFLLFGLSVSAGLRVRSTVRITGTFLAVLVVSLLGDLREAPAGLAQVLFTAGSFVVFQALPALVARMTAQRRELLRLMQERAEYLEEQQKTMAERVRVREATRIAREMHDSLGHRLTLISLYSGALRTVAGRQPDRTDEVVSLLHTTSTQAMDELRQILAVLRDGGAGDESEPVPARLADAGALVDGALSAGARITLHREGEPVPLHPLIDHAAYRTLQEGVTNALRHARGGEIRLALRYEPDALVAEVVNAPGTSTGAHGSGQGLRGLAERIRLTGGVLYSGPEPDGGFRIAATLPLTPQAPSPGPADDVRVELRRVDRSRRRAWALIAGAVTMVVALCAGAFWVSIEQYMVDRETYDAIRAGMPEAEVRARLPQPDAAVEDPNPAAGSACLTYSARIGLRAESYNGRYRFCFRDGVLVSKEMVE
ncbi:signal transduction histidine kinase [Catenuloplanes nepalensis]|uniref:histidine kinase n=1 Tax=Catenuloplanes nepalensis TaxID=587533 RepID=A0ABT9MXF4_9ACTN|nr:histidine kinase [Catenuloplanes nepalensis]MDP9796124.1 signal transduction histidine kinase [Catenuloplanes nepalensis]